MAANQPRTHKFIAGSTVLWQGSGLETPADPTWLTGLRDNWPLYLVGAMALAAVVVVFRGLKRRPDDSRNDSGGGGSNFFGRGGRW